MHREISHTDSLDGSHRPWLLYLLTALLAVLLGFDVTWRLLELLKTGVWPEDGLTVFNIELALIAAVLGGARVLYTCLESLFEGKLGADLALAIACIAAIYVREPLVAAEVVFIGLLGECLEDFTFARTQRAIRSIVEVCPRRCWLLRDGQETRALVSTLQVGDQVVVKPGARVPVDGVVLGGRSAVDTSALTGESLPADKGPGDEVLAGSLNQFGALTIEAQRVAEQTVVGRVIELTNRALKDKAGLERTADRLARYFLPLVLGLATLTYVVTFVGFNFGWFAVPLKPLGRSLAEYAARPAVAVLVVACPCALILATPAAIIAALGRLAGTGVLIKGGSALERLAQVKKFAFDKTGTLTTGRLQLGEVLPLGGVSVEELLQIAATAEQQSEHVLGRLILDEAQARKLPLEPVTEFRAQPGGGVLARAGGHALLVGTRRLLEEQGLVLAPAVLALLDQLDAGGQTALLVACDGVVLGAVGARDQVRPEAADVLAQLRTLGITEIALLTGDRTAAAKAVVESLPLDAVHAELLPQQKAELVAELAGPKDADPSWWRLLWHGPPPHGMAMVGDGINDAPALARATVGLAIGRTGTDVAAEAGDIVFMSDPLRPLPLLLRLSRQTVRIIRQNILLFAFGFNAVGIVLMAWLWQSPLAAAIYHQVGSLAVLLNSMRLLGFERGRSVGLKTRGRRAMQAVDGWIERYLNVEEWLHGLGHYWKRLALALLLILLVGYPLLGLTIVQADQVAVVQRFGHPVADLSPGLYWRWPWPIEEVVRVQPNRIRTVEVGFRSNAASSKPGTLGWASPHAGEGLRRVLDEAVMITGDGNLVEVQATVRYKIKDPRVYLFEVNDADNILRAATEATLREMIAARPFQDLLTQKRGQFQEDVLARLQARNDLYPLGIQFDGFALHDLHPPPDVVPAYHKVTIAMETRDKLIKDAEAAAVHKLSAAQADQQRIGLEAEAARDRVTKQADAFRVAFETRAAARKQLDFASEWQLTLDCVGGLLAGKDPVSAVDDFQRRRDDLVARQAGLTDFRLFMASMGQALAGRDLVLVDADRVPGRRQLLFFDPELLKGPLPLLNRPSTTPKGEGH